MAGSRAQRKGKQTGTVYWLVAAAALMVLMSSRASLTNLASAGAQFLGGATVAEVSGPVAGAAIQTGRGAEDGAVAAAALAAVSASAGLPVADPGAMGAPARASGWKALPSGADDGDDFIVPVPGGGAVAPPAAPAAGAGALGGAGAGAGGGGGGGGGQGAEAAGSAAEPPAAEAAAGKSGYVAKYGFYIHAFNSPAAIFYQVRELKKFFPGSPIYIMSDGGHRFDKFCKAEGCIFQLCPPANDRWHPWPFMRRIYDAAVAMNAEYVVMLEPDNTIHGPITRHPEFDAGGLFVKDRGYSYREVAEKLAQKVKPGYKWTDKMMKAGLCGGSYYRTEAILDAFTDERIMEIDWNYLAEHASKEVFSSDIAMPYILAARGYTMGVWDDAAQMEQSKDVPHTGPADAAFRHYGGSYPGGKPTYNMQLKPEDQQYVEHGLREHTMHWTNCQVCWNLDQYKQRYKTDKCANLIPWKYSQVLLDRYKHEYTWGLR